MNYYNLIAGANGVGKTSIYEIFKNSDDLGERINVDEMVRREGNWWNALLQIKANRAAMSMMNECIKKGQTFHHESTLPAATTIKQIKLAKSNGFQIRMYYIGVEGIEIALERVNRRMEQGGHGVNEVQIRRRYDEMPENLRKVMPHCDVIFFYDNTIRFRQIAAMRGNKIIDCDHILPEWFESLMTAIGAK